MTQEGARGTGGGGGRVKERDGKVENLAAKLALISLKRIIERNKGRGGTSEG